MVIVGAVLAVGSSLAIVVPRLLVGWATGEIKPGDLVPSELRQPTIDGTINLLLLGMDQRKNSTAAPRADTIIIVHVPATHDTAYLISIPRDLVVDIPPFPETNFAGSREKINAAFSYGARDRDGRPDSGAEGRERGANLMMRTINKLVPGGLKFNGAAIINFEGFKNVLEAIDGVQMCVDEETRSIHYDKNDDYHRTEVPYPQRKVYPADCYHMKPWEALDFARQRHFDNGDYTRQRHQQQLLMAIFRKLTSKGVLTDPGKVIDLQKSAGDLLTLDLGGHGMLDWFYTLRGINADNIVMIKTNGGHLNNIGNSGQGLTAESMQLLAAVHDESVLDFLAAHQDWIVPVKKA